MTDNSVSDKDKIIEKLKDSTLGARDLIMLTDPDGVILFANQNAEKNTGYTLDEIIGSKPSLWGGQMSPSFYRDLWRLIKEKKVYYGQPRNKRKSGEFYDIELQIFPILNKSNDIQFFLGIERDITRERTIDRSKSEFISIASHQLRTPISTLSWLMEAFRISEGGEMTDEQKQQIEDMEIAIKRLSRLVDDLLSVSRIELGAMAQDVREINIVDYIQENINSECKSYAKSKDRCIVLNTNIKEPIISNVDVKALRNVLQNLMSNAINYSPEDTDIAVVLERAQDNIKISIANKGPIISKKEQPKIFTKFYRGESEKKIKTTGSGLGLYIAKMLVRNMEGTIGFESEEGKDTTFWFSIPIKNKTNK